MAYPQGAVVIGEDPFGNAPERPYLLLSNERVPFHGEEYIAAVITTTAREMAVELTDASFEQGQLPKSSYVSPWSILTLKDWMITKQPAEVTATTVSEVREALNTYLQS
jgi:mRNA-degrading endonuclease toxin of MazEF toxin-antitoxin module